MHAPRPAESCSPAAREVPGAEGQEVVPRSAWTRRCTSTPRPPGGARAARLPVPSRRRLIDPFAPSEETKYTFVSNRARVRLRRRTVAGRRVQGPRARLATASGLQPPRGPGVTGRKGGAARAWAGLTSLQPRARSEGRPGPAPAPARPQHFARRRRRGPCSSLSGFSGGPEAGEPEPRAWTCESGAPARPDCLCFSRYPPQPRTTPYPRPPSEYKSQGGSWTLVLQVPAGPAPRAPRREARPILAPALCSRPSQLVPHPREGQRGGRSIRGIKASEGARGEENGVTEKRGGWGVGGRQLREGGGGTQREEEAAAAAPLCRGGKLRGIRAGIMR